MEHAGLSSSTLDQSEVGNETRPSPQSSQKARVWVVSELYYPEDTSTGYYLTGIAEGLTGRFRVEVLCSQPSYSKRGTKADRRECHNGVQIQRCWGTTWNKDSIPLRIINLCTISCSIFFALLLRVRPRERVLTVTNPPLLPFLVSLACRLKNATCVLLIHDVYPEVLVAVGALRDDTWLTRIANLCVRRLYQRCRRIVVLGRDMRELIRQKLKGDVNKVVIIPNWADTDLVQPIPRARNALLKQLQLSDKFIVLYAGNLGRSHDVESILAAAELLKDQTEVRFLIVGCGAKKAWAGTQIQRKNLGNVTLLDRVPRAELPHLLNAGDVALISFLSGMAGVSVPSRMYNFLAAGTPIVAATDPTSEVAWVIREQQVGWVVQQQDPQCLAETIERAKRDPERLAEMSHRARHAAVNEYSFRQTANAFQRVLSECA
jgi:glycosyltransferase involved in cell wall biosynthesis